MRTNGTKLGNVFPDTRLIDTVCSSMAITHYVHVLQRNRLCNTGGVLLQSSLWWTDQPCNVPCTEGQSGPSKCELNCPSSAVYPLIDLALIYASNNIRLHRLALLFY